MKVNIIGNIIQQTLSKGDKIQVKEYRRENKYNQNQIKEILLMNKSLIDKIIEEIKTDSFFEKFKYKRSEMAMYRNFNAAY